MRVCKVFRRLSLETWRTYGTHEYGFNWRSAFSLKIRWKTLPRPTRWDFEDIVTIHAATRPFLWSQVNFDNQQPITYRLQLQNMQHHSLDINYRYVKLVNCGGKILRIKHTFSKLIVKKTTCSVAPAGVRTTGASWLQLFWVNFKFVQVRWGEGGYNVG